MRNSENVVCIKFSKRLIALESRGVAVTRPGYVGEWNKLIVLSSVFTYRNGLHPHEANLSLH